MRAACRGHKRFETIKKIPQFKNLNDAYIILMPMFATCKMERITVFMRNRYEIKECFSTSSCEVL